MLDCKKVMFEIFRDCHDGEYRVVYFTELGEHEKDRAVNEAMHGEHIFAGYMLHRDRCRGKIAVAELLERLNSGESLSDTQIESVLGAVCV